MRFLNSEAALTSHRDRWLPLEDRKATPGHEIQTNNSKGITITAKNPHSTPYPTVGSLSASVCFTNHSAFSSIASLPSAPRIKRRSSSFVALASISAALS